MTLPEERWNERRYWDWLQATAMEAAIAAGLRPCSDDAEECVSEFIAGKLLQPEDPIAEADTEDKRRAVVQTAVTHARRFKDSERRRCKRLAYCELNFQKDCCTTY